MPSQKPSFFKNLMSLTYSSFVTIGNAYALFINPLFYKTITKVSLWYFCLDAFVDTTPLYFFHHTIAGALSLAGSSCGTPYYEQLEILNKFSSLEYSTVPLIMYYLTSNVVFKVMFVFIFFYYRTYNFTKWYLTENWQNDINYICTYNHAYNENTCNALFKISIPILVSLNIYWSYYLTKKILKEIL